MSEKTVDEMKKEINEIDILLEQELNDIKVGLNSRGMNYTSKKRTVCQVLREIHQLTDNKNIKELTIEATLMAKKMTKKLAEYSKKYGGSLADKKLVQILKKKEHGGKISKADKKYLNDIGYGEEKPSKELLEVVNLTEQGVKLNKNQQNILEKANIIMEVK